MIGFREISKALQGLEIGPHVPILAHASLSAFGQVTGGAEALLGALLSNFHSLVMPTFTYKTMLIPEVGPEDNALDYGSGKDSNRMAEFFIPDMPADRLMGITPETLRRHPKAERSLHPILSFSGINANRVIQSQSLENPLKPIRKLAEENGWVLLLGVDHCVNTTIHYAEQLAGRKAFLRWALTADGVLECPRFPGCSEGFQAIAPYMEMTKRSGMLGMTNIQAFSMASIIAKVRQILTEDPLALLCDRNYCTRCAAVRANPGFVNYT